MNNFILLSGRLCSLIIKLYPFFSFIKLAFTGSPELQKEYQLEDIYFSKLVEKYSKNAIYSVSKI